MTVQDIHFSTIEQFREIHTETDVDVLQLTAGALNFTSRQVTLPGIQLMWNQVGATLLSREINQSTGLVFGYVINSPARVKLCGFELDYGYGVLWQRGEEVEYFVPTGLASLIVCVDEALVDLLGWDLADGVFRPIPHSRLHQLEQTCRLATQAARATPIPPGTAANSTCSPVDSTVWRDRILVHLESVLQPWLEPVTASIKKYRHGSILYRRFREVESVIVQNDYGQIKSVDEVAKALGIPRRTLFHSFRKWLGMGPYAYLQLVRLHRLRDRLVSSSPAAASVTDIATELGFSHMGRMSATYHEHFGEYPSETLKRTG